ncbi:helix-turn-helix domain-containing protein [Nocardioides caeni]|uniref:helix-turn-helix domain-containing protein n=1 Tax=Nocardioides caeni TaxID=574700 RepID=UPI001305109B|nr:helix-turn-helix domain-containing protein [Nocardioides caeni]
MTTLLRSERTRRGLRAADLAQEIGVHPMSILRWERRERLPGPAHIHALARVLELDPSHVARFFDDARSPAAAPASSDGHRGQALRDLRWRCSVSVASIAGRVGVPASTVYNWEAGRARIPAERIPALADALDLSPDLLVGHLAVPAPVRDRPSPPMSPLRRLRHRARLSQTRAAAVAGVDRHALGGWERGAGVPPLAAIRRLAAAYGAPVAHVARAAGVEPPQLLDRARWRPGDLPGVVRALREWAGLSQSELAGRCHCSTAAVRTWESARVVPSGRMVTRLERAFGLPAGALAAAL